MDAQIVMPRFAGVAEGFYARPLAVWSGAERLELLRFLKTFAPNIDTYLYCPKDDPYVVAHWSEPYPPERLTSISQAIDFCKNNDVTFVYGFNPALPEPGDDSEAVRLEWILQVQRRLEQLLLAGCTRFCLLFDDLPLSYDAIDKQLTTRSTGIEEFFVELVNALHANIGERLEDLWICAPDYCFYHETALTRALRGLNRKIGVVWTGRGVFVNKFSLADLERVYALLGSDVRLIFWSNYPVNDVEQSVGVFNLGAYYPPGTKEVNGLTAILVNPMRQCDANLPFLMTFADFLRRGESYRREDSWRRALGELLGRQFESAFFLFEEFSSCNVVDGPPKYLERELGQGVSFEQLLQKLEAALQVIESNSAHTPEGSRFLGAVESVLAEARRYLEIGSRLLRAEPITAEDFILLDWFPTDPAEARNVAEVARIVKTRLLHSPSAVPAVFEIVEHYQPLIEDFEQRYPGKQKLFIASTDRERYLRAVRDLIRADQLQMLEILNDRRREPAERMLCFSTRQSINRFTLPNYERDGEGARSVRSDEASSSSTRASSSSG